MEISKKKILEILKTERSRKFLPDIECRDFWRLLKKSRRWEFLIKEILKESEKVSNFDIKQLKASWYLQFYRTGNRSFYQGKYFKRRNKLNTLVLSECFENKGRFLDNIFDCIWSICEESSWTLPAHDIPVHTYGKGLPDVENPTVALFSGETAVSLAITYYLLGEKLHSICKKRIRYEIKKRIFKPFLKNEFGWMKATYNWNPVCNSSVLLSAILLEKNLNYLSSIILKILKSLPNYLKGFGINGGTTEGISYWNFGFSHYILSSYILDKYTNSKVNLFKNPQLKEIAKFPIRVELSPRHFINFADADENIQINRSFLEFLSKRLNIPELQIIKLLFSSNY